MTAKAHSTTRRALLGAAAALPVAAIAGLGPPTLRSVPSRALWERRLAKYRYLFAAMEADAASGAMRTANHRHARERSRLEARFGSLEQARQCPEGLRLCDAMSDAIDAAENAFADYHIDPMLKAAVRLALTPAPDLAALVEKIEIMHEHELETYDPMPRHPLIVLRADTERLKCGGLNLC